MSIRTIALLLVAATNLLAEPVEGRTVTVDTTVDNGALSACDDGAPNDCSLRGAVNAAGAASEHWDILLPAGSYPTTQSGTCSFLSAFRNGTIHETTTAMCIHGDVTIVGAGADETIIDGMSSGRVLMADAASTVAIRGVTVTRGFFVAGSFIGRTAGILTHGTMTLTDVVVTANNGGGIYNVGNLLVERCEVTANVYEGDGAGIANFGHELDVPRKSFTMIDSTVAQNTANGQGAGLYNSNKTVMILGSTVSDNTASGAGGGIRNAGNVGMRLVNSTITGNDGFTGGGVHTSADCADCAVVFENVTITENHANQGGGGVAFFGAPATTSNSIIAGNTTSGFGPNCFSWGFVSQGHNVFGNLTSCDPTTGDTAGDQNGIDDPLLGALVLNGGPTATRMPLDGSPALDRGSAATPGTGDGSCAAADQRRVLRPSGERCDVGAAERSSALDVTTVAPTRAGGEGAAIVVVGGSGFVDGANVALRRAGSPDIAGDPVVVDGGGSSLATSFELTGAGEGVWDVVVTNPDATSVVLPGAFTVDEVLAPAVFAAVLGKSAVRPGVPTRYTIRYGNTGNVEALGVPLTLIVPAAFAPTMRFEVAPPPEQPGRPFNDYSAVPLATTTEVASEQASLSFLVPIIPAGFIGILEFTLTAPVGSPHDSTFSVEVSIGSPWFEDGEVRSEILTEAATRARAFAERAIGVTTTPDLDPVLIEYERNALHLAVDSSREVLLDGFGQTGRAYGVAYLAIDLAGYAAAQAAEAAEAPVSFGALLRDVGRALALLTTPAYAEKICPPCNGGVLPPGCSCKDKAPSLPGDGDSPRKPPDPGLTPAECRDTPNHKVSADGTRCIPRDGSNCSALPGLSNPFFTDPGCRDFPIRGSIDPNDKTGSTGAGPDHHILPGTTIPYVIAFENKPSATLPAQTVLITDQLDTATLDLDTFELGPILVGDVTITPPAGLRTFSGGADLRPALDVVVKVDAALDPATGIVTWLFTSLDPLTLGALEDPEGGFLPPNTSPPAGDGQVHFTIRQKPGLATGTTIANEARIFFDANEPIDTPVWTNVIDDTAPSSRIDGIESSGCDATDLTLHWSGADPGVGIFDYSVFASVDGGPYLPVISNTTELSAPFTAEVGKTYRFYTIARDYLNHVEAAPAEPDVVRTIGSCGVHDLAIVSLKAPAKVSLTPKSPEKTVKVVVLLENRGPAVETIPDAAKLAQLVEVGVESIGSQCTAPVATLRAGKPQKPLPVTMKSKGRLTVFFDVTIGCANDPALGAGHADYRLTAHVNRAALGDPDSHPEDDVCPRSVTPPYVLDPHPNGKIRDKGCGAKKPDKTRGGDVVIDVGVR